MTRRPAPALRRTAPGPGSGGLPARSARAAQPPAQDTAPAAHPTRASRSGDRSPDAPDEQAPRSRRRAAPRPSRGSEHRDGGPEGPRARGRRGSERDGPPAWRRGRPARRTVIAALALLAALAAAVWALGFSPLTAVRSISVVGTDRTAAATVEAAASPQLGTPLLRWDAGAVQDRLADAPYVSAVSLDRRWPDRIEVQVTERVPVAAVPRDGGGVDVVDARGEAITRAPSAPDGLPTVAVDARAARGGALEAATLTARSLPARLRAQVETVGASSSDDVVLTLRGGRPVRWGDRGLPESKAAVLLVLLEEVPDARGFDVSAPSAPATWTSDEPAAAGADPGAAPPDAPLGAAADAAAAESDEGDSEGGAESRSEQ